MSAGATASTLSSLTNTEVPSAFTPVTTRLMDMDASLVDLLAELASATEAVDLDPDASIRRKQHTGPDLDSSPASVDE
jgi:hypothetical protein